MINYLQYISQRKSKFFTGVTKLYTRFNYLTICIKMYTFIYSRTKWVLFKQENLFSQAFIVTTLTNGEFIEIYKHSTCVTKRA